MTTTDHLFSPLLSPAGELGGENDDAVVVAFFPLNKGKIEKGLMEQKDDYQCLAGKFGDAYPPRTDNFIRKFIKIKKPEVCVPALERFC